MRRSSRGRPPKLDAIPFGAARAPAPVEPTPEQRLERAGVAGEVRGMGAAELRRLAGRIAAGDRSVLDGLEPFAGVEAGDVLAALEAIHGSPPGRAPRIDAARTLAALGSAMEEIRTVAAGGGRIAFATAYPASLLSLHQRLARSAAAAGADVPSEPDSPPFRAGGRPGRFLRWLDGVAVVTDGASLLAATGAEVGAELLFTIRRPRLLVTDGPLAGAAVAAGIPTVAFAGIEHAALALAAARGEAITVVPLVTDRSPGAYAPLAEAAAAGPM